MNHLLTGPETIDSMRGASKDTWKKLLPPYNRPEVFAGVTNSFGSENPINYMTKSGDKCEPMLYPQIGVLLAISRIRNILKAKSNGQIIKGFGGWARCSDGGLIAEYWNGEARKYAGSESNYSEDPRIVVYIGKDNSIKAQVISLGKKGIYKISNEYPSRRASDTNTAVAIMYALICNGLSYMGEDKPTQAMMSLISSQFEMICDDAEDLDTLTLLASNIKSLMTNGEKIKKAYEMADDPLDDSILTSATVELLDLNSVSNQINPDDIHGSLSFLKRYDPDSSKNIVDFKGRYNPDTSRELSDKEKDLVPVIDEDYIIPDKVRDIAEIIQKSSTMKNPIRNFLLSGPSGTGKTEWCKILAMMLDRPYVSFGCSPDTERLDLTLSIIPNAKGEENVNIKYDAFLEPSDWCYDPVNSFKLITGEDNPTANEKDCLNAVIKNLNQKAEGFKYVYSNIIKAFKYGWVCEIQEPTIISKPGVLPALNSMFDKCKSITLMNGETITRHKDCVICFTTNQDYEGCNPMNQSIKSRCVSVNLSRLSKEELIKRVISSTGYAKKSVISKMVEVYITCQQKAEEECITDGAIDFRALEQWATANMINGQLYENGMMCLIDKCTSTKELLPEFVLCLDSQFKKGEIES